MSIKNTLKLDNEKLSNKIISLVNEPHKISDVEQYDFSGSDGYIRLEVYLNDYRDPENDMSILDVEVAETGNGYDDVLEYRNLNDVIAEIDVGLSRVIPEYLDGCRDKFGQSQD